MLAAVLVGVVTVLATGDVSLSGTRTLDNERVTEASHTFAMVLVGLQILALAPLLRLDQLIRSGVNPRNPAESWLFNILGYGIVFGLPLLSFAYFAREDVSELIADAPEHRFVVDKKGGGEEHPDHPDHPGVLDYRNPRLLSSPHIRKWTGFWERVRRESGFQHDERTRPSRSLWRGGGVGGFADGVRPQSIGSGGNRLSRRPVERTGIGHEEKPGRTLAGGAGKRSKKSPTIGGFTKVWPRSHCMSSAIATTGIPEFWCCSASGGGWSGKSSTT